MIDYRSNAIKVSRREGEKTMNTRSKTLFTMQLKNLTVRDIEKDVASAMGIPDLPTFSPMRVKMVD